MDFDVPISPDQLVTFAVEQFRQDRDVTNDEALDWVLTNAQEIADKAELSLGEVLSAAKLKYGGTRDGGLLKINSDYSGRQ